MIGIILILVLVVTKIFKEERIINHKKYMNAWYFLICGIVLDVISTMLFLGVFFGIKEEIMPILFVFQAPPYILYFISFLYFLASIGIFKKTN